VGDGGEPMSVSPTSALKKRKTAQAGLRAQFSPSHFANNLFVRYWEE
jgi:hypothetical protein